MDKDFSKLRFGWIPFWNLYPLYRELKNEFDDDIEFSKGIPTHVNRLLAKREVDLAPCSSVCLALNPEQELALPLGVACDGPVRSVYLGVKSDQESVVEHISVMQKRISESLVKIKKMGVTDIRKKALLLLNETNLYDVTPAQLPNIKLSTASATSVMLTRIFYRLWYGPESYASACTLGKISENMPPSMNPTLELIIGDEALAKRRNFHHVLDLGVLWREITDLPFVYATWQSQIKIPAQLRERILSVAEMAEVRMRVEPKVYGPEIAPLDDTGKLIDLEEYWSRIYYRLGRKEMKALSFFLSLVKYLHPIERSDEILIKIMQYQELANAPS